MVMCYRISERFVGYIPRHSDRESWRQRKAVHVSMLSGREGSIFAKKFLPRCDGHLPFHDDFIRKSFHGIL